jgi:hypothetical protein
MYAVVGAYFAAIPVNRISSRGAAAARKSAWR